jgi:ABC-type uncharacterized transport system auxiliary subunit
MSTRSILAALALAATTTACGGKLPETRYYQLATPAPAVSRPSGTAVVALESLSTDAAYDDERIVYRTSPYRLDYYQYQRWIASPGVMLADYLASSLARTGRFRALPRELTDAAPVVLSGRVIAIEEIDRGPATWVGRVAIELTLTNVRTGAAVWTQSFEETEPLAAQTPEGLAAALSRAMTRVVERAAPAIADVAVAVAAAAGPCDGGPCPRAGS